MKQKFKWILATITAVFLVCAVRTGAMLVQYPEVQMDAQEILTGECAELKDMTVDGSNLFAESNDPEMWITLPEGVRVYEIGVRISGISRANCRSYLYLLPSYDAASILLRNGMNYWRFEGALDETVSMIRFNPLPLRGVSMDMLSFTVNPHEHFVLAGLRDWAILAAALAMLEGILFTLEARRRRNGGWYKSSVGTAAAVIAGLTQSAFTLGFLYMYLYERHSWDQYQTTFYFTLLITESLFVELTYLPDELPMWWRAAGKGTDPTADQASSGQIGAASCWHKRELPVLRILILSVMSYALTETLYSDYMQHWKLIAMICNPLAYSLLYVLFRLIPFSRRYHLSGLCYALPNVLWMLAAGVNHYYFEFRAQALEFADISMAGTAGNVMGTYTLDVTPTVFLMYASAVAITIAALTENTGGRSMENTGDCSTENRRKYQMTGVLAGILYLLVVGTFLWTHTPTVSLWNTNTATKYNGYVYSFLSYMKKSLERPVPEGYSAEEANAVLAAYAADTGDADSGAAGHANTSNAIIGNTAAAGAYPIGADAAGIEAGNADSSSADTEGVGTSDTGERSAAETVQAVNLIVVMDEAFADLPTTYGFETNVDGLPFIHSLDGSNVKKGNLLVSVFGGTTADSEYEFLTGNSLAFLGADSVPYTQYIDSDQQSLASMFMARGVYSTAFHPYLPNGYKRNKIYPLLGFPQFVSSENDLQYYDKIRSYVSDASDLADLIDIWNNNRNGGAETAADGSGELTGNTVDASNGQFLFNVTMQNHGNYNSTESTVDVTVEPTDALLQVPQLEEYLSLAYATDQAFEQLIEYYETVDEPTIILLFGDHQPGLDESVYKKMNSAMYEEDAPLEERLKKYTVPYVIWANYDLPDLGDGDGLAVTSCNLLRSYFLENAGVELNAWDRLCAAVRETYPAMNIKGYLTTDGEWHENDDRPQDGIMRDYQMGCYLNLFDQEHMEMNYFE